MTFTSEDVAREVFATQTRAPYRLPPSWYEPGVDVAMADWITRFVPERDRRSLIYGRLS